MTDEYVQMTVPELKELAKERGLHVKKGLKKEELVKPLCTSESGQASASCSTTESDPETHSRSSSPEAAERSPSERERQRLHELELKRMELKRLELEAQCKKEQQQLEVKRMEMELEAKKLELEQKKLDAQLHLQSNGGNASPPQASGEHPKLDVSAFARYRDGDDPAVFLSNFKRQAQRCKVPEEKIMMYLSALVEGDMAVVLNSLPSDAADDYNAFKAAVSKTFKLGLDYFRKKFWNMRPQPRKALTGYAALLEETCS
ncbi:uncharacterized protein LOC132245709 [Alligator mississippiensis]|uniref:uncharacterized protein LOC132245709 n=1 Tax=Alligator mississippiensis TaxID=8496 RepID=UPI002877A3E4|nr:uncharacterized protein LOC132245709 [Alligator mississippiensis]